MIHNQLKAECRILFRRKRDEYVKNANIYEETCQLADRLVSSGIIPSNAFIGGYWPVGSEVKGNILLHHFFKNGHRCALPVIEDQLETLVFREWQPGQALVRGKYNIMVPDESCPVIVPAILLIPLLAFDRAGNRLGQGAGYYDRTLNIIRASGCVLAIGIAFDCQETGILPHESHDELMDFIITPTRVLETRQ